MNIEFTKAQFFALLKAVYLGNWMANANRDGNMESFDGHLEHQNNL